VIDFDGRVGWAVNVATVMHILLGGAGSAGGAVGRPAGFKISDDAVDHGPAASQDFGGTNQIDRGIFD
jgi:hypothetical protein